MVGIRYLLVCVKTPIFRSSLKFENSGTIKLSLRHLEYCVASNRQKVGYVIVRSMGIRELGALK